MSDADRWAIERETEPGRWVNDAKRRTRTWHNPVVETIEVVRASAFDAVVAECDRLREALTKIQGRYAPYPLDDAGMAVEWIDSVVDAALANEGRAA